jgi:hypothetical protein
MCQSLHCEISNRYRRFQHHSDGRQYGITYCSVSQSRARRLCLGGPRVQQISLFVCSNGVTFFATFLLPHLSKKVKLSRYAMQALRGIGLYPLLTFDFGTGWGEWSVSRPGRALPPGKDPPPPHFTHWIGGWMRLRAGLDTEVREEILFFSGHRG